MTSKEAEESIGRGEESKYWSIGKTGII
jgi:hypothetical protein